MSEFLALLALVYFPLTFWNENQTWKLRKEQEQRAVNALREYYRRTP